MRELILEKIAEIQAQEGVRIFYAVESGSRAWGFPSRDSDFDVRFLYLRPVDWYLSIEEGRDVLELPINDSLDINGWDLRKALRLLRASNMPLLEWLGSPVVYLERFSIPQRMREVAQAYFSPLAGIHRYWSMARANYQKYLQGERVSAKKYFYTLRPLLAVSWIERGWGIPPTEFHKLVKRVVMDQNLHAEIDRLVTQKQQGKELDSDARSASLDAFIQTEPARLEQGVSAPDHRARREVLDDLFRQALAEAWEKE